MRTNMLKTPGGINLGLTYFKNDGKLYIEVKQGKKKEEVPWEHLAVNAFKNATHKAENPPDEALA